MWNKCKCGGHSGEMKLSCIKHAQLHKQYQNATSTGSKLHTWVFTSATIGQSPLSCERSIQCTLSSIPMREITHVCVRKRDENVYDLTKCLGRFTIKFSVDLLCRLSNSGLFEKRGPAMQSSSQRGRLFWNKHWAKTKVINGGRQRGICWWPWPWQQNKILNCKKIKICNWEVPG